MDSGSCFTVVVFEVYVCLEPTVLVFWCTFVCLYCLNTWSYIEGPQETKMASPPMFRLHISSSFLSLIPSCRVQRIWLWQLARGSSKLWLSDTFVPQEPPQRIHKVGAIPAVQYRRCRLTNEGFCRTERGSIGRPAWQITIQYCGFCLTSPIGMSSACLQPYRQHSNPS